MFCDLGVLDYLGANFGAVSAGGGAVAAILHVGRVRTKVQTLLIFKDSIFWLRLSVAVD